MARVKLRLEVANGVMARTIEEIRENFDIKKIVGYFLGGKLKNWLETRYYEDELEKVNELSESDPELARKLCEIFGVEYTDESIDVDVIQESNERLLKLKQYTDDEGIIANIDCVAFNQEELADLYDKGKNVIYLCEGKFKIPDSKEDLTYHMIGEVDVVGIDKKRGEDKNTIGCTNDHRINYVSTIPQELADYIGYKNYVETDDYLMWTDYSGALSSYEHRNYVIPFFSNKKTVNFETHDRLKLWNKNTNEYSSLYSDFSFKKADGNTVVYTHGGYSPGIYAYDIVSESTRCLTKDNDTTYNDICVSNGRIAFLDNKKDLNILDINDGRNIHKITKVDKHFGFRYFNLCGDNIFYVKGVEIIKFNLSTNTSDVIYKLIIPDDSIYNDDDMLVLDTPLYMQNITYYNNYAIVICWDKIAWKTKVIKIDMYTKESRHFDVSEDSDYWLCDYNTCVGQSRNIVFLNNNKINVFDVETENLKIYSEALPSSKCQIRRVGDYLYWGWGKDRPSYRVNLNDEWNPVSIT